MSPVRQIGAATALACLLALAALLAATPAAAQSDRGDRADSLADRADRAGKRGAAASRAPRRAGPKPAKLALSVTGLRSGRSEIMRKVPVRGVLAPYVRGQRVELQIFHNAKLVKRKRVRVRKGDGNYGYFTAVVQPSRAGKWAVSARHRANRAQRGARTKRRSWKLTYPAIGSGECGPVVVGFKRALKRMGYITNGGKCLKSRTGRGILAYRRVNGMEQNRRATSGLVHDVFRGKGGFKPKHPGAPGVHMEVPLDKQVLVFADGGKVLDIYPISSGKPSTPTVTGSWQMDWTQPGYNDLDMYYSWYFYRGYAIHGYKSVPDYPASNGCIRTFEADQPEIFNRISKGDWIYIW